ncbi:hypothetical protein BTO06_11610 [Tenacibaculum sp. SZ-18]|uniref:nucleotidyltransferase family protein n=1 Tax=Tenacibaculum sp. SZ-18 TaxID=754423 RepID=UPI000C2D0A5B|nr:nucleotidyltransferase family protein [Tenacibaculum sp. SZ-18]AUC15756.1 hypothetical protein BTO06_11610 [Tenacibaculum sp. SZ-18]
MTYKETLFFIGKCLTITHEINNKIIVENLLQNNYVDWDDVVKVSTSHYVFPALYCNLKRTNLLHYLPEDLVGYMQHITQLNRERNEQIIEQANEINSLLLKNNITPIFLKGTGNLLEGLYEDIAERMVGDIDFLVTKADTLKSFTLLKAEEYTNLVKTDNSLPNDKHLPRIHKKNRIAAVEVHKEMVKEPYNKLFNYSLIKSDILNRDNYSVLGYNHQLILSIIAKQINDDGQFYNDITLRNAYDVFLLSKKTDTYKSIETLDDRLKIPLNNFLAITKLVLNSSSINFVETNSSKESLNHFNKMILNEKKRNKHYSFWRKKLFLLSRLKVIFKAFYSKNHAIWLIKRIIKGRNS